MNETSELILTIVVFGLMFGIIIWLMIYWSRNNTVVDERDKKWYKKEEERQEP
jgi:preprotein translocase subunit SecG